MSPPDKNPDSDELKKKLEELESLLDKDGINATPSRIKVPVLDELVTEIDFINSEDEENIEQIEDQITDLADKLERKLAEELDQLVRLLKDNLKYSIVEELRNQANIDEVRSDLQIRLEKEARHSLLKRKKRKD